MRNIEIAKIDVGECEDQLLEVVRSGALTNGKYVRLFEERLADFIGVSNVVGVNSGTGALYAALSSLGIGPGDEVIVPGFTFAATINSIIKTGATAVVVDVSEDEFTVTPDSISGAINQRTAGILPVHLFGNMCRMNAIESIAERNKLFVLEDAAQALGSDRNGRHPGSSNPATFSFYPSKLLTTAEGGAIATNDSQLAESLRTFRSQGMKQNYEYSQIGDNLRLSELHACLGLSQVGLLEGRLAARASNARVLNELLADVGDIDRPISSPNSSHSWHQYTVSLHDKIVPFRENIQRHLQHRGVDARIYYPNAVSDSKCYRGCKNIRVESIEVSRKLARRVLSLPVHDGLDSGDMARIAGALSEAIAQI